MCEPTHAAIASSGSRFWIFGGEGDGGTIFSDVWKCEVRDGTAVWVPQSTLSDPRTQSAAATAGTRAVLFGGWNGQTFLSDTVFYRMGAAYPGDFNGDGMNDVALFRSSTGMWSIRNVTRLYFGSTEDIPVTR